MMDFQVTSVGFGPGMDTKTDPKVVAKPVLIQDGIFTNFHRISKRNGYDNISLSILGGGTISNPVMSKSYKDELVCAGRSSSGQRLFSYSESLSKWVDKGKYVSAAVSKRVIAAPGTGFVSTLGFVMPSGVINANSAIIGNTVVFTYDSDNDKVAPSNTATTYFCVLDSQTDLLIYPQTTIVSSYGTVAGFSKVCALGSSRFAIFYVSVSGGVAKLCFQTLTVSGSGVVQGAEVQLNTISSTVGYVYDVQVTSSGAFVSLANGNAVVLYTLDPSGSTTHGPTSIVTTGNVSLLSIQLNTTGTNAWVYWCENVLVLKYAVYNSSTLSSVLSATTFMTIAIDTVRQITALATSATAQTAYFSVLAQPANFISTLTLGVYYPTVYSNATLTTSGCTPGANSFKGGVDIYGKPFSVSTDNYLPCVSISQTNPVGLILDLSDGNSVAKFLPGSAEGLYRVGYNTSGSAYAAPTVIEMRWPGFLTAPLQLSSTLFGFAAGFSVTPPFYFPPSSTTNLSAYPSQVLGWAQLGVCLSSFDFNHKDSYQSLLENDTLLLNGGIVSQYDGSSVTELQYTIDPDHISVLGIAGGGAMGPGTYIVWAVYEWVDGNGNLVQSAASAPVAVYFSTGSTNSISVALASLTVTQKSNVQIAIYATVANGTIGYRVGYVSNGSGWGTSALTFSGANIDGAEIYTVGGTILDNIAPPPSMILWSNKNRAWCVDSENPETTIQYAKTSSQGTGVSFSSGFLEYIIDSKGGAITGASPMDEKTVIIKENALGYFIGDGDSDAGTGSTLTNFQFIPSDTGGDSSRSVILFPDGIIFKASNQKGIYLVSRGVQVLYFGYDVERYNSQDITSAVIVPNKNQIRFLTSSGSSLLYDYVMKQWSVFTNHAGLSADNVNGVYIYTRADGLIYSENSTSFLDNATSYALSVQLQWIKATAIQDFYRIRRVMMLGDYSNGSSQGHGVQISAAYDFGTSFSQAVPYLFGQSSSSGAFQYRERLSQQKCDAIQLLLQEVVTGASGEYCDFTDLGLETGSKRGLNKLPQYRSVG